MALYHAGNLILYRIDTGGECLFEPITAKYDVPGPGIGTPGDIDAYAQFELSGQQVPEAGTATVYPCCRAKLVPLVKCLSCSSKCHHTPSLYDIPA